MSSPRGDVLIVFGGSGVGKSTMCRQCAIRWPAKRYVDVATIREVMRPQFPELELSTYGVWRLAGKEPTPQNLVTGFEHYASIIWPTVLRILKRTAVEQNNLVLEGAILSPRLLADIQIEGLRVHPRMLHVSDPNVHLGRIRSSSKPGSSQEIRLVESFPLVRALQDYMKRECSSLGIPVVENVDFQETQRSILHSLPTED